MAEILQSDEKLNWQAKQAQLLQHLRDNFPYTQDSPEYRKGLGSLITSLRQASAHQNQFVVTNIRNMESSRGFAKLLNEEILAGTGSANVLNQNTVAVTLG